MYFNLSSHHSAGASDSKPLLVFINGKSGGNQGVELLSAFRNHLNPHQVYDLTQCGPIPGLYAFRHLKKFRILIGGGDGTFSWVLAALTEIKESLQCQNPPSALLPLGTGTSTNHTSPLFPVLIKYIQCIHIYILFCSNFSNYIFM